MRGVLARWSPAMIRHFCDNWNAGLERDAMRELYGPNYQKIAEQLRLHGYQLGLRRVGGRHH